MQAIAKSATEDAQPFQQSPGIRTSIRSTVTVAAFHTALRTSKQQHCTMFASYSAGCGTSQGPARFMRSAHLLSGDGRHMRVCEVLQVTAEKVVGGQKWPVLEHTDPTKPNRTRVVVLGSGWGAISMVKALNAKIRSVAA